MAFPHHLKNGKDCKNTANEAEHQKEGMRSGTLLQMPEFL
jgi:hypothetical protein